MSPAETHLTFGGTGYCGRCAPGVQGAARNEKINGYTFGGKLACLEVDWKSKSAGEWRFDTEEDQLSSTSPDIVRWFSPNPVPILPADAPLEEDVMDGLRGCNLTYTEGQVRMLAHMRLWLDRWRTYNAGKPSFAALDAARATGAFFQAFLKFCFLDSGHTVRLLSPNTLFYA